MSRSISVIRTIGHGRSELSAYDDALFKAGIGNCNIIALSSVIPTGWVVEERTKLASIPRWGNRLYVVRALSSSDGSRRSGLSAGIGWTILDHGGGLMVEHYAMRPTAEEAAKDVENKIDTSIADICLRREATAANTGRLIVSAMEDGPTCALVVAIFQDADW
jgi:arginine decarboxylase